MTVEQMPIAINVEKLSRVGSDKRHEIVTIMLMIIVRATVKILMRERNCNNFKINFNAKILRLIVNMKERYITGKK